MKPLLFFATFLIITPVFGVQYSGSQAASYEVDADAREAESLEWAALGAGGGSLFLYTLTFLGVTWLALPAVILGIAGLGLGIWLRRKRKVKNWRTLVAIIGGGAVTLVFMAALGFVLFF